MAHISASDDTAFAASLALPRSGLCHVILCWIQIVRRYLCVSATRMVSPAASSMAQTKCFAPLYSFTATPLAGLGCCGCCSAALSSVSAHKFALRLVHGSHPRFGTVSQRRHICIAFGKALL